MSAQPSCLAGQPSACAWSSHIAITSGVRNSETFWRGTHVTSAVCVRRRPQSDDDGVQMTGCSVPALSRSRLAPDETFSPFTNTTWPLTVTLRALKSANACLKRMSFSGEYATGTTIASAGACTSVVVPGSFGPASESPDETLTITATRTIRIPARRAMPRSSLASTMRTVVQPAGIRSWESHEHVRNLCYPRPWYPQSGARRRHSKICSATPLAPVRSPSCS